MTDQIKLGIGSPAYGRSVVSKQNRMWREVGWALANATERFMLRYDNDVDVCGVDVARNAIVEEAIEADCDWLLMIDADTWALDGFDLIQMISTADRKGAAVIVAPVRRRDSNDDHPMVYRMVGQVASVMVPASAHTHGVRLPIPEAQIANQIIEIDSAATAIMAIDLRFLQSFIKRPWFEFKYIAWTNRFESEDLGFCDRVRAAGGTILCDGRVQTGHRGRAPDHEFKFSTIVSPPKGTVT